MATAKWRKPGYLFDATSRVARAASKRQKHNLSPMAEGKATDAGLAVAEINDAGGGIAAGGVHIGAVAATVTNDSRGRSAGVGGAVRGCGRGHKIVNGRKINDRHLIKNRGLINDRGFVKDRGREIKGLIFNNGSVILRSPSREEPQEKNRTNQSLHKNYVQWTMGRWGKFNGK